MSAALPDRLRSTAARGLWLLRERNVHRDDWYDAVAEVMQTLDLDDLGDFKLVFDYLLLGPKPPSLGPMTLGPITPIAPPPMLAATITTNVTRAPRRVRRQRVRTRGRRVRTTAKSSRDGPRRRTSSDDDDPHDVDRHALGVLA